MPQRSPRPTADHWPDSLVPLRFTPVETLDGGDLLGLYRPISRGFNPIVCLYWPREDYLIPLASSEIALTQIPFRLSSATRAALSKELWKPHAALEDANSSPGADQNPRHLLDAARRGAEDEAVPRLLAAIAILPEYGEAHADLGDRLVERGDLDGAARRYINALTAPPFFGPCLTTRQRLLGQLRAITAEAPSLLESDPIFAARHTLRLQRHRHMAQDLSILEDAIEDYLTAGRWTHAVGLRLFTWDLARSETSAFRAQWGYSFAACQAKLHATLSRLPWACRSVDEHADDGTKRDATCTTGADTTDQVPTSQ